MVPLFFMIFSIRWVLWCFFFFLFHLVYLDSTVVHYNPGSCMQQLELGFQHFFFFSSTFTIKASALCCNTLFQNTERAHNYSSALVEIDTLHWCWEPSLSLEVDLKLWSASSGCPGRSIGCNIGPPILHLAPFANFYICNHYREPLGSTVEENIWNRHE